MVSGDLISFLQVLKSQASYNATIVRSIAEKLSRISDEQVFYGGDVTTLTFISNRLVDQVQTQVQNASADVKSVITQTFQVSRCNLCMLLMALTALLGRYVYD